MDKVLTAWAWGWMDRDHTEMIANGANGFQRYPSDIPVVIVHGATESDILAGLSLLAKSREVCYMHPVDSGNYETDCGHTWYAAHLGDRPTTDRPCWCGRRVSIKEFPQ